MGAGRRVLVDLGGHGASLQAQPHGGDPTAPRPDRKVARAAAEFQADLKEEFAPSIDSYLDSLNDERADWFSIFFLGPLWTYILQHAENRQRQHEALDRLFAEMAGCIVVVPQ